MIALTGLILNVAGTAIIWIYGIPANIGKDGSVKILSVWGGEPTVEMKATARRVKRYARLSNLGMLLILLGFVLQACDLLIQK